MTTYTSDRLIIESFIFVIDANTKIFISFSVFVNVNERTVYLRNFQPIEKEIGCTALAYNGHDNNH